MTLSFKDFEFNLRHAQPAAMIECVMYIKSFREPPGFLRRKCLGE